MEHSLGNKYSQVVNVLIFIFPIVIISLQVAGDLVLFILAIMGIFIAISQKLSPFIIKEIKVFSYLTTGYFAAVCLSVLFSGKASELLHYIPRDFHFLFAPFIALTLFKAKINLNYLILGSKVALLLLGLIIMSELLSGATLAERKTGVINANVFGNLSVFLFYVVLVFFQNESLKSILFTLLSLFSGLFVIFASGSRGAWLSFLFLFGFYLYFLCKQKTKDRMKLKFFTLLSIFAILLFVSSNQFIKDRVYSSYQEISNWKSGISIETGVVLGDKKGDINTTSAGQRLGMYKLALSKIADVPFFGHGYRTSNKVVFEDDKSLGGQLSYSYNHLHNAYLTNYFNGGIVLLGALLLILFVPFRIFIKASSQNHQNPAMTAGALLTLGYASFGMVNILLGDTYMNGFYVFFLSIFLLLSNKSINTS
jgi:O-antigen ligase